MDDKAREVKTTTPPLTTRAAAAERLCISQRYLDIILRRERVEIIRIGRCVRIPVSVVEQLAQRGHTK